MFKKIVSFNATIDTNIEAVNHVLTALTAIALDTAHLTEHVMVSTYDYVDQPDEGFPGDYHDDKTLFKVLTAMEAAGFDRYMAIEAIQQMQNAGILFRERHPEKNVTLQEGIEDNSKMKEYLFQEYIAGRMVLTVDDRRPHSVVCGIYSHPHGKECNNNCPTCHGEETLHVEATRASYKLPEELKPKSIPPMYNA
jgi:hypothetical protein